MKKLIVLTYLLFLAVLPLSGQESQKIVIAINDWLPFKYETPPYGILAQITQEAFALEGLEVEFRVAPWRRGYDYAVSGRWHGIVGWNRTPARERLFHITTPLILEDVVFFHHKDFSFHWETIEDLEELVVGVVKGYNYGEDLKKAAQEEIVELAQTAIEDQSIRMLLKGRIDLWPSEVDVGLHLIKTQLPPEEAEQLTYHPRPINVSDLCLLLSRNRPENQEYFNHFEKGLAALKASGRYDELMKEALLQTPFILSP